ncbi:DUF2550 domain-containing protein [Nocardiopsis halotolerans]|uniref:DUF2550 domain-containing protein n=1 Tax=Nocardiopsis halotolerans TaxID=124252 RepID=UPI00034B7F29|nr:DUF2550 domain-containing protein [Nocardiopsis halotolerans]
MERLLPGAPWWESALWVFFALLVVLLVVVLTITLRRWVLVRRGGAVECYLRAMGVGGRRGSWRIGFCRYGTEDLAWFPIFSLRPRPTAKLSRRGLVVVGRRAPERGEDLPVDLTVLQVAWTRADGSDPLEPAYEIAMNEGTLTGFLSWLESMPPGTHWEG